MHLIWMILALAIWIIFCHIEGISKARNRYLLNAPELDVVKNGIKWLREHNLNKIRYFRIVLIYISIIIVKSMYLIEFHSIDYKYGEVMMMWISIILIPILVFPFFHDRAYYHEYNRLARVTYDEPWYYDRHIPATIRQLGKQARLLMLLFGLGLLTVEIYIFFR